MSESLLSSGSFLSLQYLQDFFKFCDITSLRFLTTSFFSSPFPFSLSLLLHVIREFNVHMCILTLSLLLYSHLSGQFIYPFLPCEVIVDFPSMCCHRIVCIILNISCIFVFASSTPEDTCTSANKEVVCPLPENSLHHSPSCIPTWTPLNLADPATFRERSCEKLSLTSQTGQRTLPYAVMVMNHFL